LVGIAYLAAQSSMSVKLYTKVVKIHFVINIKPLIARFYNNSKGKTGKQTLLNRSDHFELVWFGWIGMSVDNDNDNIRRRLKHTYFNHTICDFIDLFIAFVKDSLSKKTRTYQIS